MRGGWTVGSGEKISFENGKLAVPDEPIIPYIEGDGIGPDIWQATVTVLDHAVRQCWSGRRRIVWEKAFQQTGEWLPQATIDAFRAHRVGIKGPLTTPVGKGIRSLNVALRQRLDLYACVRPIRHFPGVPSPVRDPQSVSMVVFRENTEDVYAGLELEAESKASRQLIDHLAAAYGWKIRPGSGIGIKPISKFGSVRLIEAAIDYAVERHRRSVTLVHKGNIQKYTEGAFRNWGYELAKTSYPHQTVSWQEVDGNPPEDKVLIKDAIADIFFQQALTRPAEFDVIATTNLNGDYISDAAAAQVGGLGMAPGANIGDYVGLFEATHGTAPKYADKDVINPTSVVLSGCMMFEYLGWDQVSQTIYSAIEKTIEQKTVTYDLHRLMDGATKLHTSEYASAVIDNM